MIRLLCMAWILALACMGQMHPYFEIFNARIWPYLLVFGGVILLFFWRCSALTPYRAILPLLNLIVLIAMFAVGWQFAATRLQQYLDMEVKERHTVEGIVYIAHLSEGKRENWRQPAQLLIPEQHRSLSILLYPKPVYYEQNQNNETNKGRFSLGQFYKVTLDIKPPHGYVNLASFDQEKWLLQNNIHATATVLYSEIISSQAIQALGWYDFVVEQQSLLNRWKLWIEQLRQSYRTQLLEEDNKQNKALLLGLLTGDRSGLEQQTILLYQQMGISHLLAISGPHVLLLAAMLTWLMSTLLQKLMAYGIASNLYRYVPKPLVNLPIFFIVMSFYVAFTGFEIPALRTWVMVSCCSLSLLLRLAVSPVTVLFFAASVILIWDSFAVLSASFWLSFIASAVLLFIYRQLQSPHQQGQTLHKKVKFFFSALWQSQWRLFIALTPIVIWQFKTIALLSPILNLVAIPFISLVIVPLDIIAAVLWQVIPVLGAGLWSFTAALLAVFNAFLVVIAPLAQWLYIPCDLDMFALLSLLVAVLIISVPAGLIAKYWALCFLVVVVAPRQKPMLQMDVLDVGQGQAIVIQTAEHLMLVDTGKGAFLQGQMGMGTRVIYPFLRSQGGQQIDEVLLSHLDFDHSGGLAELSEILAIKLIRSNVYDATITGFTHIPFLQCQQGQRWQWDGVDFEIMYPTSKTDRSNANESSCVLRIRAPMLGQHLNILIMGDLGWEGEYYLLQDFPDLRADVLVVGHHGSRHSSAYDFLAQLQPKLAVISAGHDNRYGHPAQETLARLNDLQITAVNTADLGMIHVQLKHQQATWQWQYQRATRKWLLP